MATTTIPAARALIGFTTGENGNVDSVCVLDQQEVRVPGSPAAVQWAACRQTHGACFSHWLMAGDNTMTPEAVFGELVVFYGFADSNVAEHAIAEFARIDTCAWARAMVPTETLSKPTWRAQRAGGEAEGSAAA